MPYLVGSAKLDEKLVGGTHCANLVAHQYYAIELASLLVLVQHELVVFARSSFGSLAHSFGCTSPIYCCVCFLEHNTYSFEIDLFLLGDHLGSLLAFTILGFGLFQFACHIPYLSTISFVSVL